MANLIRSLQTCPTTGIKWNHKRLEGKLKTKMMNKDIQEQWSKRISVKIIMLMIKEQSIMHLRQLNTNIEVIQIINRIMWILMKIVLVEFVLLT